MAKHLQTEIDNLKKKILALGGVVEENLRQAVKSVVMRDMKLANEVIEKDGQIDQSEVELEEDCLKILALHQPVAIDLRFIIAVLKINNDLERIGDEAVNIAERGAFLATQKSAGMPVFNYSEMADKAQFMLRVSLDSLVRLDAAMAGDVGALDDEVDAMNREIFSEVKAAIRTHPEHLESLVHLLGISRHLERIADHATNIAEDVIYMTEGIIARHRHEDFTLGDKKYDSKPR